jgi:hypothetical protein
MKIPCIIHTISKVTEAVGFMYQCTFVCTKCGKITDKIEWVPRWMKKEQVDTSLSSSPEMNKSVNTYQLKYGKEAKRGLLKETWSP